MRRLLSLAAVLVLLPAAMVLARGGGEGGAAAAGTQATPVTYMMAMGHQAPDDVWQRVHDYIEQQTGVKFIFRDAMDTETYDAQLTAAIAAQEPIDAFMLGNKIGLQTHKNRGTIQDITDAVNKYGPNMKKLFQNPPGWQGVLPGEMWKVVTVDGKIWAVPGATAPNQGVVLSIRKDWREKLGMAPITTLAQFEEYMRKVKDGDLDGNGKADTIPYLDLYGDGPLEGTASSFVQVFTGQYGWMHEWYNSTYKTPDGGIAPTILHPQFKAFLQKVKAWYAEGLLYRDVLTSTWDNGNDLVAANRVASITSWYSDFFSAWETLTKTVPAAEYEVAVLKKVDGSVAGYSLNDPAYPTWGFTAWSKNVPFGIGMMDWFAASKDNYIVQVHGAPTVDWKWVDKDTNKISKTDPKLYAYSFLGFNNWNGVPTATAGTTVTFGSAKRTAANQYLAKQVPLWNPDWFISYNWKDTPIEKNYVDASTFINEAITNYVVGRTSDADWDRALAQYKTMWADEFSKQASAIFKAAK